MIPARSGRCWRDRTPGPCPDRRPPGRGAPRPLLRCRLLPDLGSLPALLAAAGAGRGGRDHGPPGRVVPGLRPRRPRGTPSLGVAAPAARRPGVAGPAGPRCGADRRQLGALHLGRQQRARRRDVAGLLHQPGRDRPDRCRRAARATAPVAVGGCRDRGLGSGRPDGRLRAAAVDRTGPGGLLRDVRTAEEAGRPTGRRAPVAHRRDRRDRPAGAGLPGRARGARRRAARALRGRSRAAARVRRRGHRDPAALLRGGCAAGAAERPGAAAVPHTGPAVPDGCPALRRADAGVAPGRLRAHLGRARAADVRQPAHPPVGSSRPDPGPESVEILA